METQWLLLSIMVRTGLECSIKKLLGPLKLFEFVVPSGAWFFIKNSLNTWDYNKISSFCLKQQLAFSIRKIQCFLFKLSITIAIKSIFLKGHNYKLYYNVPFSSF